MSGIEELLLYLGTVLTIGSLGAILRPDLMVKESRSNRDARLRELEAGAPEAYFEERRELEAYAPPFDLSHARLRQLGMLGLCLGLAALAAALL